MFPTPTSFLPLLDRFVFIVVHVSGGPFSPVSRRLLDFLLVSPTVVSRLSSPRALLYPLPHPFLKPKIGFSSSLDNLQRLVPWLYYSKHKILVSLTRPLLLDLSRSLFHLSDCTFCFHIPLLYLLPSYIGIQPALHHAISHFCHRDFGLTGRNTGPKRYMTDWKSSNGFTRVKGLEVLPRLWTDEESNTLLIYHLCINFWILLQVLCHWRIICNTDETICI